MLFKRKEEKKEDYFYRIKPKRFAKIRQFVLSFLLVFGCLGGYVAIVQSSQSSLLESVEEKAFITQYIHSYYTYPQSEEDKIFVKQFSLKNWKYDTVSNLKAVNVIDFEVIQLESDKQETTYYYAIDLNFTFEDFQTKEISNKSQRLYQEVKVVRNANHEFLVISDLDPFYVKYNTIDESIRNKYTIENAKGTSQINDTEKQIINDLISVFFNAYNTSYDQAMLLVDKLDLPYKDSAIVFELSRISNTTRDNAYYYVETEIKTINDVFSTSRNAFFKIDISKQKIVKFNLN